MRTADLSRTKRLAFLLAGVAALSCSGQRDRQPGPTEPAAPKPLIYIFADSLVITTPATGRPLIYRIGVSADDTTRVHGLAAMPGGFDDGDSGAWLSAQLDRTAPPAELLMRVDPGVAKAGRHPAVVTITAPGADPKILHLVLVALAPGDVRVTSK